MTWSTRWQGKNLRIDPKDPHAFGVCDRSGFVFNREDLFKQMEWRGNNLVWTGLFVAAKYLDEPQEQNRPPVTKADPYPVKYPRPLMQSQPATFGRTPGQIAPQEPPPSNDPDFPVVLPYPQLLLKLQTFNWNS